VAITVGRVVEISESAREAAAEAITQIATINPLNLGIDSLIKAFARSKLNYTAHRNNFLRTFGFKDNQAVKHSLTNPCLEYGPADD
jgi:hypothetical protein